MKAFILVAIWMGSAISFKAQSFEVIDSQNDSAVSPNEVVYLRSTAGAETDELYTVRNTDSSTQVFSVRKYEDQMNTVAPGDEAQAFFCTGGNCFVPSVNTASFALAAGDSMMFKASFQEASVAGASSVRYKISATSTGSSLEWTINYYALVLSIKGQTLFSTAVSEVYPNPATSDASISVRSAQPIGTLELNVFNYSGQLLNTQKVAVSEGDNQIPISITDLPAGLYFLTVRNGGHTVTKKFLVSRTR